MERDNPIQPTPIIDQVLKINEVSKLLNLSKNTIYTLARTGLMPKPLKLSQNGRSSGFLLSEIRAYLQSRVDERNAQGGVKNGTK